MDKTTEEIQTELTFKIIDATKDGRIVWLESDALATYIASSPRGSLTYRTPVPGGRINSFIEVRDFFGEVIYTLHNSNLNLIDQIIKDRSAAPGKKAIEVIESML